MSSNEAFKALADPTRRASPPCCAAANSPPARGRRSSDMTKPSMSHHSPFSKKPISSPDGQQMDPRSTPPSSRTFWPGPWTCSATAKRRERKESDAQKIFILEILLIPGGPRPTAVAWPHLPAMVPTHWEPSGPGGRLQPQGLRFSSAPGSMAVVMLSTWLLPWLLPRRFEVDTFSGTYRQVMLMVFLLIAFIQEFMLWSAFGHPVSRLFIGGVCLSSPWSATSWARCGATSSSASAPHGP